jgi:hypothetical protein
MNVISLVQSIVFLGLPVLLISWFLFHRLYTTGRLDRDARGKDLETRLKQLKEQANEERSDLLQSQLMKFGGGFYGVTALWTLIVIELGDFVRFASNLTEELARIFDGGIVSLLISVVANQFTNFISAILWFGFWPDRIEGSVILAVAAAYSGYLLGLGLARADTRISFEWIRKMGRSQDGPP